MNDLDIDDDIMPYYIFIKDILMEAKKDDEIYEGAFLDLCNNISILCTYEMTKVINGLED